MISFIRHNLEYILLIALYSWVGYCSIVNMGSIAGVFFLLLVVSIGLLSARASFCAMFSLLFGSMASLNMPSPIIISSAIFFIFNAKKLCIKGKRIPITKLVFPYLIFLGVRVLSSFNIVNSELYTTALTIDSITFISIILGLLLLNNYEDVEFCERWIGILGVLATTLGFFYFIFNESAYLGQLYADTDFAGKGVIEGADLIMKWLRWVPIDKEPNFWGAYLLFPFGYWLNMVSKKTSMISVVCLGVTFLGILFTYSRASFLVSMFITLSVLFKSKRRYFFSMTIAFAAICVGIYIYSPDIVERILSISNNITSEGGSGRFELWGEALNNFEKHPILGIGTGQTPAVSKFHLGTHNTYLQILGENGFVGLAIFLFIWLSALIKMKSYRLRNSFYYYAFLGLTINFMTVHCMDFRIPFFVILLFYIYTISFNKNSPKVISQSCSFT